MEAVQSWTREYFLNNQEVCLQKLKSLTLEERSALRENLEKKENKKIVLVSAMIIDTQEPEFYCEKYEVKSADGSLRVEMGKFADKLNISDAETVEDPSKHLSERQTILISKSSSTNPWVYEVELQGLSKSNKRKLEDNEKLQTQTFTVKVGDLFNKLYYHWPDCSNFRFTTMSIDRLIPLLK